MKSQFPFRTAAAAGLAWSLVLLGACGRHNDVQASEEPGPGQSKVSVYLTDGPGLFDQVLVDIRQLAVKVDTSAAGGGWWKPGERFDGHRCWNHDKEDHQAVWDTIAIQPGVYDLLNLANGADTLLASDLIPQGRILAFRLTLGEDNSLVKDSVSYPLNLLPDWHTVYIRVHGGDFEKLSSRHYKIWLDFDAGRSVVALHHGEFYLKPVLRAFAVSQTGRLAGRVLPADAQAVVSVYNDGDTLYAIPGRNGQFMLRGLEEGNYDVLVNASSPYMDTTLTGVSVSTGKLTDLGTLQLHQ